MIKQNPRIFRQFDRVSPNLEQYFPILCQVGFSHYICASKFYYNELTWQT